MGVGLRLSLYECVPGEAGVAAQAGSVLFAYAPSGDVTVDGAPLGPDEGAFAAADGRVAGPGKVWLYEVADAGSPFLEGPALLRSQRLSLAFAAPYVVRADRIESRPGDQTPRHGHRGPGIRRLVFGCILAEVGEGIERIDAGHSWFETGHDMVVGTNIGETNGAFVRVMVLPAELEGGKSSFMPADETEAAKPRRVMSRLFGERMLPGEGTAA